MLMSIEKKFLQMSISNIKLYDMTELDQHLNEIEKQKVFNSIMLQLPIEVTSYTLSRNMEAYFRGIVEQFLDTCHHEHLKEYLNFCLGELLTNSKKANTKRVYFKEKGLDINDPDDYAKGMESFKQDTFEAIDHYLELQKKEGLNVKLKMHLKVDQIIIEIKNNCVLTKFEEERIKNKIEDAQQYHRMEDVVANVLDQSEGAGLGIIIIILMLEKVGLSKNNFRIYSTDTETITEMILPCDKTIFAGVEIISYEYANLQNKIPVIKQNFEKVNALVSSSSNNSIDKNSLLGFIRRDVTLSLLLLKYAREKDKNCFNLSKALNMISDDELKFIYSDSNPSCDFMDMTPEKEKLWGHAYKVAFFAYNLYKNSSDIDVEDGEEYFYLAGLMNNFGRVLLSTASEEQKSYIKELSDQYEGKSQKILDIFKLGNTSNYLTLVYFRKFGFSEETALKLSTWNTLHLLNEEERPIVSILYLAEMMCYYEEGKLDFYQLDKDILARYKITDEKQFKTVINKLESAL